MKKSIPVLAGTTWPAGSPRLDHYRLYTDEVSAPKIRKETMVFNGMDGVVINDDPSTKTTGCWADIESQPKVIEELVGPRGLAFLKLLSKHRTKTAYFFYGSGKAHRKSKKKKTTVFISEIRVVSAWQFTVVSSGGGSRRRVFSALRKHTGLIPIKKDWVIEKGFQFKL